MVLSACYLALCRLPVAVRFVPNWVRQGHQADGAPPRSAYPRAPAPWPRALPPGRCGLPKASRLSSLLGQMPSSIASRRRALHGRERAGGLAAQNGESGAIPHRTPPTRGPNPRRLSRCRRVGFEARTSLQVPHQGRRPMPDVGDRVRVQSTKVGGASRDGVVTRVIGRLLHVRWSTGEESTIVPAPGSMAVIGKVKVLSAKKVSTPANAAGAKKASAPARGAKSKTSSASVRAAKKSSR